ncbi:hypothetical protein F0562_029666 [Nyssa sinensis]|uniref:Uncharacterized protein n=1 Tax=Nyssa sinensis TaxID=561372 RepID=A0A5J5B5W0_9ASTE|nr:hypothetical protein F0562_029666 [Nyssa sinensis]
MAVAAAGTVRMELWENLGEVKFEEEKGERKIGSSSSSSSSSSTATDAAVLLCEVMFVVALCSRVAASGTVAK